MIVGIDSGLNGAIAFLSEGELLYICDMPTLLDNNNKKYINAPALYEILNVNLEYANLEKVHSSPQMGVTSAFSMGRSYGVIVGVLAGLEVPVRYHTPQAWKKRFHLIGTKKDMAREKIIHMMPEHKDLFRRKKDIDRADATFIAMM